VRNKTERAKDCYSKLNRAVTNTVKMAMPPDHKSTKLNGKELVGKWT
jgi:hypothetical protein